MSVVAKRKARLWTEHFYLRDDEAQCADCDWSWSFSTSGIPLDRTLGTRMAKRHVRSEGHEVTMKRVEFARHHGVFDD